MLASAPLLPKFVSDGAAVDHELRERGTSVPARRPTPLGGDGPPRSDRFLQFLGGAERDLLARLDLNRFAGRRIASHARRALAHLQDAEPADPDAVALLQVLRD